MRTNFVALRQLVAEKYYLIHNKIHRTIRLWTIRYNRRLISSSSDNVNLVSSACPMNCMHEVRQRFHQRTKTAASKAVSRTLSAIDTEVCNKTTFRLSLVFVRTLTDVSLPAFARRCC